ALFLLGTAVGGYTVYNEYQNLHWLFEHDGRNIRSLTTKTALRHLVSGIGAGAPVIGSVTRLAGGLMKGVSAARKAQGLAAAAGSAARQGKVLTIASGVMGGIGVVAGAIGTADGFYNLCDEWDHLKQSEAITAVLQTGFAVFGTVHGAVHGLN